MLAQRQAGSQPSLNLSASQACSCLLFVVPFRSDAIFSAPNLFSSAARTSSLLALGTPATTLLIACGLACLTTSPSRADTAASAPQHSEIMPADDAPGG